MSFCQSPAEPGCGEAYINLEKKIHSGGELYDVMRVGTGLLVLAGGGP